MAAVEDMEADAATKHQSVVDIEAKSAEDIETKDVATAAAENAVMEVDMAATVVATVVVTANALPSAEHLAGDQSTPLNLINPEFSHLLKQI